MLSQSAVTTMQFSSSFNYLLTHFGLTFYHHNHSYFHQHHYHNHFHVCCHRNGYIYVRFQSKFPMVINSQTAVTAYTAVWLSFECDLIHGNGTFSSYCSLAQFHEWFCSYCNFPYLISFKWSNIDFWKLDTRYNRFSQVQFHFQLNLECSRSYCGLAK